MQVHWITFHSGYDFGYLLKILTCQPLPLGEPEFFELLRVRNVWPLANPVTVAMHLGVICSSAPLIIA